MDSEWIDADAHVPHVDKEVLVVYNEHCHACKHSSERLIGIGSYNYSGRWELLPDREEVRVSYWMGLPVIPVA